MSVSPSQLQKAPGEASVLLRRFHAEGDPRDLDLLVRQFAPLARKLALRFARGSEPIDDLVQTANLALVKALKRFDPDRGFAFTSFAVPTILGELKRSFRDTAWAVRVPRMTQELVAEVRVASDVLVAGAGRAPTVEELGAETGRTPEEITDALQAGQAMTSLSIDAPGRDEADGEPALMFSERLGGEDDGYELVEDRAAIESALPFLSDVQRQVLRLRFSEGLLQSEIAQRLDVSQMQVSRILRAGLDRLGTLAHHQSLASV